MKRVAGMVCGAVLLAPPAGAGEVSSIYTRIDLDTCKLVERFAEGQGAAWRCPGHAGLDLRVVEGDLRFYIGYGRHAERQTAMRQTVPQFNTIHSTLEWRVERRGGKWNPFATILRYHWDADGEKGQTLVVTRLGEDDACHVGYVKADGNARANEQARAIADDLARDFDCEKGEAVERGAGGRTSPR